jgi:DNA processing protein
MIEQELKARLALNRLTAIGPDLHHSLIEKFGSACAVFDANRSQLEAIPAVGPKRLASLLTGPDTAGVEQDLEWLTSDTHHVVFSSQKDYPGLLNLISRPPPVLFLNGRKELLMSPQLAIVGSRNPTPAGVDNARAFARHLSCSGLTICSGLAQGIDGAAHEGALDGKGSTIAVTGTGMDRIYPASHRDLAHRIAAEGLLVSEFPLGVGPDKRNFPRRNRIISGLSMGCLVVEATRKSGSLITAQYALEQGREVYAIPGSIHSPMARGCHWLIRQGAKLVETADDIIEELPPVLFSDTELPAELADSIQQKNDDTADLSDDERTLMKALGHDPATIDTLVDRTGWVVEHVSALLLDLELRSRLNALPGGIYVRTYP